MFWVAPKKRALSKVCDLSDKTIAASLDVLAGLGYIVKSAQQWRIAAARQLMLGELLPIDRIGNSDSPPDLSTELSTPIVEQAPLAPENAPPDDVMSKTHGNSVSPIAIDSSSSDPDHESKESTTINYRAGDGNSDSVIRENKIILRALGVEGKNLDILAATCPSPQYIAGKHAEWQDYHERMMLAGKGDKAEFGLFIFWLKERRDVREKYRPPRCDLAELTRWANEPRTRLYSGWMKYEEDEQETP